MRSPPAAYGTYERTVQSCRTHLPLWSYDDFDAPFIGLPGLGECQRDPMNSAPNEQVMWKAEDADV